MEQIKRYVVRCKETQYFYNGNNTFGLFSFEPSLLKAKIFKNINGAKAACHHLCESELDTKKVRSSYTPRSFEIVETITILTDNIIPYTYK